MSQIDEAQRCAELYAKGNSYTQIAREEGIPRSRVISNIQDWQKLVMSDSDIKTKAKELLLNIDLSYQMLIKELWWVIEEAKLNGELKEMTAAAKAAGQLEKDRSQLYSTAGITADDELADQLAAMEMEHETIKQILKEISADCPRCRAMVYSKLAEINGQPEVIVVQEPRGDE